MIPYRTFHSLQGTLQSLLLSGVFYGGLPGKAKDGKTVFFTAKNAKERKGRQKHLRSSR